MPGVTSLAEPTTVGALEAFAYRNLGVVRHDEQLDRTIYQVEQDELLRAAETLHKCFAHDPVIHYLIDPTKDDEKKESLHRRYFQVFSNLAYLRGYLHQVNDFSGVILWFPPNATRQSSPLHLIRAGFVQVFRHVGLHGLRRFFVEYLPQCDQSRSRVLGSRTKYYHIFFMGVLPRFQHTDLAARLLEHVVHLADTDRLPCLVECASEGLLMLYEQFGFRIRDVHHLGKGDAHIPMWTLVRQPGGYMPQAPKPGVVLGSQSVYSPNHSLNRYHVNRTPERHSTDRRQSHFAFDSFASEPAPVVECTDSTRTSPKPSLKKRASLFGLMSLKPWKRSSTRSREPHAASSNQRATVTSTTSAHTAPTPSTASSRIFSTVDVRPNLAGYAPTYWSRPSDASVNTIQPLYHDDPMRRGRSSNQSDHHFTPSNKSSAYPTPLVAPDTTIGPDICVDPLTLNKPLPQPKECFSSPENHNRLSYPSTRTRDSVISAGVATTATSSTLLTPLSSDASSHEDHRGSHLVDPLSLPPFCPLPPIPTQSSSPATQDRQR
ncbi:hypothetical protein H4R34_001688 [Dimargaris verticillata]|uniref:N-acetyltransferase domain-containing protein n=1 Tax=Dimargaris verticillata TaxID=2761393 RepID=A0A9W8EE94_9FUNG|nr:hypothetical protein H4R34_001688 [Dimargaris verticillata]